MNNITVYLRLDDDDDDDYRFWQILYSYCFIFVLSMVCSLNIVICDLGQEKGPLVAS